MSISWRPQSLQKKSVIIVCASLAILGSTLLVSRDASTRHTTSKSAQPEAARKSVSIPESAMYGFIFSRVDRISRKTKELRAEGKIGPKPYLPLKKEADLTEAQARALEAIASACQREVTLLDQRAKVIIEAFKAQFPEAKIPQGATAPPPPPELKALWEERNTTILRARDQLRSAFGEQGFYRFDQYTKAHFGASEDYVKERAGLGAAPAAHSH